MHLSNKEVVYGERKQNEDSEEENKDADAE
jgi:hypothetical protein